MRRARALSELQKKRGTRVIAMIHRQETVGVLGVPFYRFIDIEDSEAVLRVIRLTDDATPIDLVLHTPGGLVLASEQIAYALKSHPAKVTVIVPTMRCRAARSSRSPPTRSSWTPRQSWARSIRSSETCPQPRSSASWRRSRSSAW